ncbi:MAG: hypothetical protein NTZ32_20280 [Planctomycetales bacterium]|nr:hypothetical protein [Planctomycetales bacterium]
MPDRDARLLAFSGYVPTASCSVNVYLTLKEKRRSSCQQGPGKGPK